MNKISINDFVIDAESPPFIIAEAGLNHNGKIEKALEMIKLAKNSGADAIKFQTFKATEIVSDKSLNFTYKSQGKMITESQLELFKRCELDRDNFFEIKKACDKENILFLSTPQNRSDLDLLLEIGIPAIKVGSDDFTNIPLLKNYSNTGLPLIVSCGMSNLNEIRQTLSAIGALENYPVVLMLTTSEYPTLPTNVNLLKLETLSRNFPDIILGYSDHTQGILASSLAVAFGAKVFEKHFTLDKNLPGPDQWFSEDPTSLKKWVSSIRTAYDMLGYSELKPTKNEEEMKILARRSVVTLCDIEKGETFNEKNIGFRRPGNGLPPTMIEKIYNKKSSKKILKDSLVKLGDFI
jgi:sialic acid synthase SpsE